MRTPNPINWKQIDQTISQWAAQQLEVLTIPEKRNRPEPARPYCSFKRDIVIPVSESRDAKWITRNNDNDDGQEMERTIFGHREFTVTVQAYSDSEVPNDDAPSMLSILLASLSFPSVRAMFRRVNVAIINPFKIIDLSAVIGSQWVSRAALDFRCRTMSQILADRTGYIGQVVLQTKLSGGVNGEIDNTITAPVGGT